MRSIIASIQIEIHTASNVSGGAGVRVRWSISLLTFKWIFKFQQIANTLSLQRFECSIPFNGSAPFPFEFRGKAIIIPDESTLLVFMLAITILKWWQKHHLFVPLPVRQRSQPAQPFTLLCISSPSLREAGCNPPKWEGKIERKKSRRCDNLFPTAFQQIIIHNYFKIQQITLMILLYTFFLLFSNNNFFKYTNIQNAHSKPAKKQQQQNQQAFTTSAKAQRKKTQLKNIRHFMK